MTESVQIECYPIHIKKKTLYDQEKEGDSMYINTDDYGLVFSGGGGKGAFEIGVWKALREMKRYPIGAVSGTSVGALNAALYATGDYEKAEELWENISLFKVLAPKFNLMKNAAFQLMIPGNPFLGMLVNHVGIMAACLMFNDYLTERSGLFSRDGLVRMIEESRVLDQLPKSTIPCFATCFNISKCRTESFLLNAERGERISDILQASSSIPAVFPLVELDQNYYCDGGIPFFGDNIPIQPLYDVGFRKFIVVHLRNPRQDERDKMKRRFEDA